MTERVGQQLGNYRLLRLLGQGAFAEVYLGEHQYLERPAAIKVLHVRMEEAHQESFRREARIIARLHHPRIIDVHDFGVEDHTPYLVMEYTPGGTLRTRHPKGTCLSGEQIVIYIRQIASALDYAHGQHVIHRDIKPENLLLDAKQEVLLSDFGLAVVQPTLDLLSLQGLTGTPLYMAPEQIQHHPCPASDQYALGIMVYEWICGQLPFGGSLYEIFSHHLHQPPPSLCARLPHLPPPVEEAVFRALAKDPGQRFVTVQDFAKMLEDAYFATRPLSLSTSIEREENTGSMAHVIPVPVSSPGKQEHLDQATQPLLKMGAHMQGELEQTHTVSSHVVHDRTVTRHVKPSIAQINRQRLLRRVRSFWITGVLEQSLHGAILMTLGLEEHPDALANPWHLVVQQPEVAPRPLPQGMRITEVYDHADGELLILGAPGAGKTTLLLELARDLLHRAECNEQHPMPVVFNLSSWAIKQPPLVDWLVEELSAKYQVPRQLGYTLVEADQILPLLDGLDEVAPAARTACIEAVNGYRKEHGLLPLVVCSRTADYLAQSRRILLRSAVAVQSLMQEQVDAYLARGGEPLEALRVALHQDATLQEFISTPLMLSILILTYHGKSVENLLRTTRLPEWPRPLFEQYVGRMLTRRGPLKTGTSQQMVHWLSYLARQMRKRNQTIFYLEHLQPDSLTCTQRGSYTWMAVQLPALLIGILVSLSVTDIFGFNTLAHLVQYAASGGLLGWLFSSSTGRRGMQPKQLEGHHRQRRLGLFGKCIPPGIIMGLIFGLSWGLDLGNGYGLGDWLRDGSISGVVIGLSSLVLSWVLLAHASEPVVATTRAIRRRLSLVSLIQTIHGQRTWSVIAFLGAGYGLNSGLSVMLYFGAHNGPSFGLSDALYWVLSVALNKGLIYGIISVLLSLILQVQAEGIALTERLYWTWHSLMRSLLAPKHRRETLLVGSLIGLIYGLVNGLGGGLSNGLSSSMGWGLSNGLSNGLGTGLLYWLLLGLFQGVSSERIEDHARYLPNQGVRRSLYNSMLMALISSVMIGVIDQLSLVLRLCLELVLRDWLGLVLYFGLSHGLSLGRLSNDLGEGLSWAASEPSNRLSLAICGGLLVCASRGGLAVLRHYVIRLQLARSYQFPGHAPRFLEEATARILLRRVGGGYIFVHRLLLEYFASLDSAPTSENLTQIPTISEPA